VSGFAGGQEANPTYEAVSSGRTGHYEVVEVTWDPTKTSYEALLAIFWPNVDPLDDGGQFCDRGPHYRTAVFVADEAQRQVAQESLAAAEKRLGGRSIVTPILAAGAFWAAEDYHQDFWKKSPIRYQSYRLGCGRDRRLTELWGAAPTSAVH
jgi:peptide-methionine (S)-S-oxide reductase